MKPEVYKAVATDVKSFYATENGKLFIDHLITFCGNGGIIYGSTGFVDVNGTIVLAARHEVAQEIGKFIKE